ncbi:oligopeptide ABC transporter ATP-binding protein [Pandoraea terrae]|uniref:Oligopeptide ABC transporter ATP-binding protein n=1 Tax=Pandoraea terrae TaxID=1537710 RepID=A0A5E4W055_9BURK|nr:oligopeptide/dipeptide ABC transporter ATP-binding protein [Pandoraea terrae]VVE16934.1 oligopeptide ABC transporter ATP-binding protein [Pandoraea terrae]
MSENLLEVNDLRVYYTLDRPTWFAPAQTVYAVDGVSFSVRRGTAFGLVGESGCGKSTTALATLRLIEPTSGSIRLDKTELTTLGSHALRSMRQRMQIIFQDPYSSLNPRSRVADIIEEPMILLTGMREPERRQRVDELIRRVGLRPEQKRLFPHQFSGGQRQRIGIARALAARPELVVCDEPVSALDVAIQAQILNLLAELRHDLGLTYLFISHDLAVVQHLCEALAVMYLGKIVEQGDRRAVFSQPLHPYTHALLSAEPAKDPALRQSSRRVALQGDPPSPINPPSGCRFHTRCPYAEARCRQELPSLREVAPGHAVACHLVRVEGGKIISPVSMPATVMQFHRDAVPTSRGG